MTEAVRRPRRGDEVEVLVERVDRKGDGVGRLVGVELSEAIPWADDVVRVRGGLPGAHVRARVVKRRKGELGARLLTTLAPGPDMIDPRCAHVASCGGCAFQGLAYPAQLAQKERVLADSLAPLMTALAEAGRPAPAVAPIAPAPHAFGYRNKMDFTFGNRRFVEPHEPEDAPDVDFALGLHARGVYSKVLNIGRCDIAFPGASEIAGTVRRLAQERGLDAWDVHKHTGLLRLLVVRRSEASGEVLVNLVTAREEPEVVPALAEAVRAEHPEIATFVQTISTRAAQIAVGERELTLFGRGYIEEELGGLTFRVSAASFFQTNTPAADALARLVAERVTAGGAGVVYDLCCGAGLLGLVAAAHGAREVHGFELVSEAVADARLNAGRNGVDNATFVEGDLAHTLFEGARPAPDVCIADPPRAGLHPRVAPELARLAPPRVVYVSCNPSTAARDLIPLVEAGYELRMVEPLDLFPHTPHLECVLTLERP